MAVNEQDLAAIKELWHTQPKPLKDKWLTDPRSLERLRGLWQDCVSAPDWIEEEQFPQVRLLERLDQGGNFLVLLGVHEHGLAVCVKVPNYSQHPSDSWAKLDRAIENERAVLSRLGQLDTPGRTVPKLIDFGYCGTRYSPRTPYLVMAYLSNIKSVSRCRPGSASEALKLWTAIAGAVGQLHQMGIVHGDLHEENLFVDSTGNPVILDFGSSHPKQTWWKHSSPGVRDFIPHISTAIDEVALPHQRLSPAFDVFCMSQCMLNCVGSHFPFEEATKPNQPRIASRLARENRERARCFHEVIRHCSANEPEFRLQTGTALARAIEAADRGQSISHRPSQWAHARVVMRRYPMLIRGLAFAAILLLAVGYFVVDRWRLAQAQLIEQLQNSEHLAKALNESNRASSIAFDSIGELLTLTVRDDYQVPDQKKRWVNLRQSLADRLALILELNTLDEQTALESLQTGLKLIKAHYEVDGVGDAFRACQVCLKFCERFTPSSQENQFKFRILHARVLADAAHIVSESQHLDGYQLVSLDYAMAATELFHSLDISKAIDQGWLEPYLSAADDVLRYGAYNFRAEDWAKSRGALLAQEIFDRTLNACSGAELPLDERFALAQLVALRALMLHKGALPQPPGRVIAEVAEDLRRDLSLSKSMLAQCERQATELSSVSLDQVKSAQAAVSSLAGLSYIQTYEYAAARRELAESLDWSEERLRQRPGSIRSLFDYVHVAWNLADTYMSEAHRYSDISEPQENYVMEAQLRAPVVQRCVELVGIDRCPKTKEAHLVNALRLASAYRLAGNWDKVCQTIEQLEQVQPLSEPGTLHGAGEDLLLNLAVLIVKTKAAPAHVKLFDEQCLYIDQLLNGLAKEKKG